MNTQQFFINGQWVNPAQAHDFAVTNPSTEATVATISLGSQADVNAAVAAAKAAFGAWSTMPVAERLGYLDKLLAIYLERAEDMAQAISQEMGAPIALARAAQVAAGAGHLKNAIRAAKSFAFERPLGAHAPSTMILREPIGVCALITPWNWPMNQVMLKVAPALAVGCTVILKPSELSPMSALLLAEYAHAAGLPAGVFNLVNGDGAGVGAALTQHPDVDMVSFTGSTRAGTAISIAAAPSVKRVALELGGKGANLVFADADEKAVTRGVRHCFNNSGQSCNAPTRMLVERSAYDAAVATAAKVAQQTAVGLAADDGRHIGPVVSQAQFNKIQALIQKGIDEGAHLVAGGPGRAPGMSQGWFVQPTVFADVTPDMTLWREEVFGPVLVMAAFDNEAQAVAMANDTPYGLTNYVQTQDTSKAQRVARQLRSGMVEVNGESLGSGSPFGGYKQSGNGRESGVWGLEEYLETKAVSAWGAGQ